MLIENTWRVLVVDDDEDFFRQIREHYEHWEHNGNGFVFEFTTDFDEALALLEQRRFDLVMLDVFRGKQMEGGDDLGIQILEKIKARRFVPVIFFTALPAAVAGLESPLVKIAGKQDGLTRLNARAIEFLDTPLLKLSREIYAHIEETMRKYLWEYVPANWSKIVGSPDDGTLAYLICRRLAYTLDVDGAQSLASKLSPPTGGALPADPKAHPLRFYVMPPTSGLRTGDILKGPGQDESYWLILTPWCDLTQQGTKAVNAEFVTLVKLIPLTQFNEYTDWIEPPPSQGKETRFSLLVGTPTKKPEKRQEGRYHFLPGAVDLPALVIDFQQISSQPIGNLTNYLRLATLDSPYNESVVSWYLRFVSRIGTPDLDTDKVIANLRALNAPAASANA